MPVNPHKTICTRDLQHYYKQDSSMHFPLGIFRNFQNRCTVQHEYFIENWQLVNLIKNISESEIILMP